MPTLFIRVLSPAVPTADGYEIGGEWLIVEDDGAPRASGVTDYRGFNELLDGSAGWLQDSANIVLIVPSEFVLGVSCEVPGRNVAQIRKALPFVVEEFVASDIEGMHLAHGAIRREEPVRCNLVERTLLAGWRDCFADLGASPGYIVSEAELLPDEPDTAYALFDGDHVLIKTADQAATIDRVNLPFAAASLAEGRLRIVGGALKSEERAEILDNASLVIDSDDAADDSTLGYLALSWQRHRDSVINLMQGEFSPVTTANPALARWRSVGILAACWVGLGFVLILAQGFWAGHKADQLEAEALELYSSIWPDDSRVTAQNLRRRAQSRLGEASSGSGPGLLSYLSEVAQVIDPSLQLNGMNFSADRAELSLDVLAADFNRLDAVKEQLEGQSYAVEIVSAQQEQDNRVRARLRVSAPPS
ncbi:MAG: type II secretion system protein GspL [Pseudomonadales bacterium]